MIIDGYLDGLGAAVDVAGFILGATAGVVTAVGPWAFGVWLLARAARRFPRTRLAWRIRAWRTVHRMRGSR